MRGDKNIVVQFIDGKDQAYDTCGNYFETDDCIVFQISKQDDPKKNLLIFLHEFIEYAICTNKGITESEITDFDLQWEIDNPNGIKEGYEPGNCIHAPYYHEHFRAETYERMLAYDLEVDWNSYEQNLISK